MKTGARAAFKTAFVVLMGGMASLPAWAAGPAIPENPTVADKKTFLADVLRYIDEHKFSQRDRPLTDKRSPPACREVVNEVKKGNVQFIEPEAFDAARKPQAVLDIEKRYPKLELGVTIERDERWVAARNFSLYRLNLGPPNATPVFFAENGCTDEGRCSGLARFTLIDPDACATETATYGESGPHHLIAVARIATEYFIISLSDSGAYGQILVLHIPSRRPFPAFGEWFGCGISPENER